MSVNHGVWSAIITTASALLAVLWKLITSSSMFMVIGTVRHQRVAMPLHNHIVDIVGWLALMCICGGIFAISKGRNSDTLFSIFGAQIRTGSVGVALIVLGLLTAYLAIRAVLKSQKDLARLPPDLSGK